MACRAANAAEEIVTLRRRLEMLEQARMTRMRDEIGDVRPRGQSPRMGDCGVKRDDQHAGLELGHHLVRDLAHQPIRQGQNHYLRRRERFRLGRGGQAAFGDVGQASFADFHQQQRVVVFDQIVGQPAAHFAAGTQDGDG